MNNGKKQVAALWILGVLVVILIVIIVGLFIMQAQTRNQEVSVKNEKITQMEQNLSAKDAKIAQMEQNLSAKDAKIAQMEQELSQINKQLQKEQSNENSKNELPVASEENQKNDTNNSLPKTEENANNTIANSQANILGEWRAYRLIDEKGKELSLDRLFGSLILISNKLTFREDMRYINSVGGSGAGGGTEEGQYTITENIVTLTDLNQTRRTLTYNETENTLTEDYLGDGTRIVTYIKISDEEKNTQAMTEQKVIGSSWKASKAINKNGAEVELNNVFNTSEAETGHISFTTNHIFSYETQNQEKSIYYKIRGNTVTTWGGDPLRQFSYDMIEDTLREERTIGNDRYFITYVRN